MEIEYMGPAKKNQWAFLGMGFTVAQVRKEDPSPYMKVENIDPAWMKAMGIDERKIHETKVKELEKAQDHKAPVEADEHHFAGQGRTFG